MGAVAPGWQPSPQTWQPLADTWHQHRQAQEPAAASSPPAIVPAPAEEESLDVQEPAPGGIAGPTVLEFHSHPAGEPFSAPSHPDDVAPPVSPGDFLRGAVDEAGTFDGERARSTDLKPVAASEDSPQPEEEEVVNETLPPARGVAGALRAPVGWWLLPLVWFNAAFDVCMVPFGAPGRILCGRSGRSFLGSLGLLGLAAALALFAAFRIGWTW